MNKKRDMNTIGTEARAMQHIQWCPINLLCTLFVHLFRFRRGEKGLISSRSAARDIINQLELSVWTLLSKLFTQNANEINQREFFCNFTGYSSFTFRERKKSENELFRQLASRCVAFSKTGWAKTGLDISYVDYWW